MKTSCFVVAFAMVMLMASPISAMLTRPFASTGLGQHVAAGRSLPSLTEYGNFTYYTFEQDVDHFDPLNTATYKQRYAVDASAWSPGGPVFIFLSGEGKTLCDCSHIHCFVDATNSRP